MNLPVSGWRNKKGTADRSCGKCGSWLSHWEKKSGKTALSCSVESCSSKATLGAHVININVVGEKIVPVCDSCNKKDGDFNLKGGITCVSAVKC